MGEGGFRLTRLGWPSAIWKNQIGHDLGQVGFSDTAIHDSLAHFAERPQIAAGRCPGHIFDHAKGRAARLATAHAIDHARRARAFPAGIALAQEVPDNRPLK